MTRKTSLEKEIAQAEDRILPKQGGDNLQRRLEDYARRFEEGDEQLSQYPSELFEPKPEPLHEKPVEATLEAEAGTTGSEDRTRLKSESTGLYTPSEEYKYSEIKSGWTERIERRPDGSEIRHVHLDLTQVSPDEPDELDREPFDWSPSIRGPSLRDVKRAMGLE